DRQLISRAESKNLLQMLGGNQVAVMRLKEAWTKTILEDTGLSNVPLVAEQRAEPMTFAESISIWYEDLVRKVKAAPTSFEFQDGSEAKNYDEVTPSELLRGTPQS